MKKDDNVVPKIFVVILLICIWYLIRRNSGEYYINKGLFEILIVSFLYFTGEYLIWMFRYYRPHVCVNGFSGSIEGRPRIEGDYAIFACGYTDKPIAISGKLATLVVPKDHIKKAGRNYVGLTYVKWWPLLNLPHQVSHFLYHHEDQYNTQNIFFGYYSEEFLKANEKLPKMIREKTNYERLINERDRFIEGDDDLLIEKMKTAKELGQDSIFGRFLSRRKKEDDE